MITRLALGFGTRKLLAVVDWRNLVAFRMHSSLWRNGEHGKKWEKGSQTARSSGP